MPHTGNVIRPQKSPGLLRVFTSGYAFGKDSNLYFKTPDRTEPKKGTKSSKKILDQIKERFVVFVNNPDLPFGRPVRFSLESYENWSDKSEDQALKDAIPQFWKDKYKDHGGKDFDNNFQFKYIATEVEPVPDNFVLSKFYGFIEDLEVECQEKLLEKLSLFDEFEMMYNLDIGDCETDQSVCAIKVLDGTDFDNKFPPGKKTPKDSYQCVNPKVDDVLEEKGRLKIRKDEIPIRRGRFI